MTISNLNTDKIKSSEIASKINELVVESNSATTQLQNISGIKIITSTTFGPFGFSNNLIASGTTTVGVNLNLAARFNGAGNNNYSGEDNILLGIYHQGNAYPAHACYAFPNYVSNPVNNGGLAHRVFQNNSDKSQTMGSFAIVPVVTDSNGDRYLQMKIHDPAGDAGHSSSYQYHVIGYAK
jgi:hypothetical protein